MIVPQKYRLVCKIFRLLILFLLAGLVIAYIFGVNEFLEKILYEPVYRNPPQDQTLRNMLHKGNVLTISGMVSILGFFWVLWAIQRALYYLGEGKYLYPVIAKAMKHVGWGLLAAILSNMIMTLVLSLALNLEISWLQLFNFTVLIIIFISALLIFLSGIVGKTSELQTELEEFV